MTRLGRLRRLSGIYRAKFATELAVQFAYRGALVIWLLGFLLEPTIYLVVWTTVANSQGGAVGGFTAGEFAGYFIVLMIVNQLTFDWHAFFMEWRIRTGNLSPMLLRPVHPIHNDVAKNLTFKALTFTILGPAAVHPRHRVRRGDRAAALAGGRLRARARGRDGPALRPRVVRGHRRVLGDQDGRDHPGVVRGGPVPVGSGGAAEPVPPDPGHRIGAAVPVDGVVPGRARLGRLGPQDVAIGFGMQALWIVIALVLLRVAWPLGIRRYSAVGA